MSQILYDAHTRCDACATYIRTPNAVWSAKYVKMFLPDGWIAVKMDIGDGWPAQHICDQCKILPFDAVINLIRTQRGLPRKGL